MSPDLLQQIRKAYSFLAMADVSVVVARIGCVDDLFPAEISFVSRVVEARRQEFAAGRWCARRAVESAGGPTVPIPQGRLFEPIWPDGFGGSITHDNGIAAAVAYRLPCLATTSIGIDLVDCSSPVRFAEIAPVVLSDQDRLVLGDRIGDWLAIAQVFSAKEAAIKILSPDLGRFIELTEINTSAGLDGALLAHPESGTTISTRWVEVGPFLVTLARRVFETRTVPGST